MAGLVSPLEQEHKIIARALNKDQSAFTVLVVHYQQALRQYCRRLAAADHALADDLAQDTFVQAFRKLSLFKAKGSFAGWLFRIAYFEYLQYLRKHKITDELVDEPPSEQLSPESQMMKFQQTNDLEQAMSQLSVVERSCLTLQFSFGYHQNDIAELLSMPLGTVKSHINRGKEKLSHILNIQRQHSAYTGAA